MEPEKLAFTAVYLRSDHGYVGFVEELPGVNSHGRTLGEAREMLQNLAALVFDEERRESRELLAGKEVVRESFSLPMPKAYKQKNDDACGVRPPEGHLRDAAHGAGDIAP